MSIWLNEFPFFPENKTLQMVDAWGGWSLFQELLRTLKTVASKHEVSIPTVAVKYILDQVFTCFNHFPAYQKESYVSYTDAFWLNCCITIAANCGRIDGRC